MHEYFTRSYFIGPTTSTSHFKGEISGLYNPLATCMSFPFSFKSLHVQLLKQIRNMNGLV